MCAVHVYYYLTKKMLQELWTYYFVKGKLSRKYTTYPDIQQCRGWGLVSTQFKRSRPPTQKSENTRAHTSKTEKKKEAEKENTHENGSEKAFRLPGGLSLLPLRCQKWIICYWFLCTLPPPAHSSQLGFRIHLFSDYFHKSLLIDPSIVPHSGACTPGGVQAQPGFVPWLFTRRNNPVALINFHLIVTFRALLYRLSRHDFAPERRINNIAETNVS